MRVDGTEKSSLENVQPCPGSGRFCVDTVANTIFLGQVSVFSDWSASELAPTAAGVTVSGRVTDQGNTGIRRAFVTITDPVTNLHYQTYTNTFGNFHFNDVPAGSTYVVTVMHGRYQFENSSQVVNVVDNVSGLTFVGALP